MTEIRNRDATLSGLAGPVLAIGKLTVVALSYSRLSTRPYAFCKVLPKLTEVESEGERGRRIHGEPATAAAKATVLGIIAQTGCACVRES